MSQHFLALGTLGAFWGPSWASQSISHYFSGPVLKFTQRAPFFFATTSWAVLEHSWALIGPGPFRNPFLRPSWSLSRGPRSISQKFFGPSWSILWPSWAPQSISHYFSGPVLEFIQGAPVQCRNSFFLAPLEHSWAFIAPPVNFALLFLASLGVYLFGEAPVNFAIFFGGPLGVFLGPLGPPGQFRIHFLDQSWSSPREPPVNFATLTWGFLRASLGRFFLPPRSSSQSYARPVLEFTQGAPGQCRNHFRGPLGAFLGFSWDPRPISHYLPGLVLEFIQRAFGQFRNTSLGLSWSILGPFLASWSISHYYSGPVLEFTQRAPGQFRNSFFFWGPLGAFLARLEAFAAVLGPSRAFWKSLPLLKGARWGRCF